MTSATYGYCPRCGAPGIARERRPDGNDRCAKGHDYPSAEALAGPRATAPQGVTGVSLRDVVAFLRPRGALGVIGGAPFFYAHEAADPHLRAASLRELTQIGDAERVATVLLYLGTSEICPAAEGWAARVLALAVSDEATHIDFSSLSVAELLRRDRLLARYIWHDYPPRMLTFRERPIIGAPPVTPADRLAAVLRYEMERAR